VKSLSKIEKLLDAKKSELDELVVPEELEARLNSALANKSFYKRKRSSWKMKIAVLAVVFLLATYNMDTLAFYGRELIGFDRIMNGTLKELNKMGMGQSIDKSYTFTNGIIVTLNGVMIDDNQLLAFYTIENPNGNVEEVNFMNTYMKGVFGRHDPQSAQGEISEDKSTIKWVGEFEPPNAFEKKLTWVFNIGIEGRSEEGTISFILDRDKAMGHTLKSNLNKTIKVDGTDIRFDTITASPTTIVLKGTIQNIFELASDQLSGERIFSPNLNIKLLADGREIQLHSTGASTDMKGMKFEARYDALPKDLEKLQLHLVSFGAEHEVNEIVKLNKNSSARTIQIRGQDITIEKIDEAKGETLITITTEESVILTRVYLLGDNNKVELTETIEGNYDKKIDGTITHTRTLRFKAAAKDLQLEIQRMKYIKTYDEYVDIPID
jgi:hypothetical protein